MNEEVPLNQRIVWGVLVLVIVGLVGVAIFARVKESGPPLPVLGEVKDFSFVDQTGKPFTFADLKGRVWVADFIFTRCAGTCTVMSGAMSALNKQTADLPDVKLVSFSMDPEFDTPLVLGEYGKNYGADPQRWKFLTGKKDEMYRITREDFKLVVTEENGTKEEPIVHSTRFVLVDGRGRIRGYYNGTEADGVKALLSDLRRLVKSR